MFPTHFDFLLETLIYVLKASSGCPLILLVSTKCSPFRVPYKFALMFFIENSYSRRFIFGIYVFGSRRGEVGFSFNNTMYAQGDGFSMGTPLNPVLANIFVGLYESLSFEKYCKPHVYLLYVDDTFSIFNSINDAGVFHIQFNSFRPIPSIHHESGKQLYFAFFRRTGRT